VIYRSNPTLKIEIGPGWKLLPYLFRTHFLLHGAWWRRRKLGKQTKLYYEMAFLETNFRSNELSVKCPIFTKKSFRLNDFSVKWCFGQMNIYQKKFLVKWHFGQTNFRSNDYLSWLFIGQTNFRSNELLLKFLSVKWPFGEMNFRSNGFRSNSDSVKESSQMAFHKIVFGQKAFGQKIR
jgi:hypothetical protein